MIVLFLKYQCAWQPHLKCFCTPVRFSSLVIQANLFTSLVILSMSRIFFSARWPVGNVYHT